MLIFFCWKIWIAFAVQKLLTFFQQKNIRILYIESTKTVNEMTLNELVKLTTLWTTGLSMPKIFQLWTDRQSATEGHHRELFESQPFNRSTFLRVVKFVYLFLIIIPVECCSIHTRSLLSTFLVTFWKTKNDYKHQLVGHLLYLFCLCFLWFNSYTM